MKKLQQLFASVVLTLLLSISAFAGDGIILTMRTDLPSPPPPSSVTINNASAGEGIIIIMFTSADSATVIVLNLLQSVLARF